MEKTINLLKVSGEMCFSGRKGSIKKIFKFFLILVLMMIMVQCTTKSSAETIRDEAANSKQNTYIIEREIPDAGKLTAEELKSISIKSNSVLLEMDSVKWLHSYVAGDKVYCVYTAPNEELVIEHARRGGFPANSVTKVANIIDPSTGN